jgi:alcohol dehydrogenase
MVLRGIPTLRTPLPMIPGADIAAEIVALGSEVDRSRWRVGQRVAVVPNRPDGMMGETLRGGLCEYIVSAPDYLLPLPAGVSDAQAACLPTAYATAYRMMFARGGIEAGERVLLLGASGGVGTCCVELAKIIGCELIACTSSAEKAAGLLKLGAAHAIDGSTTDFVDWVRERYGKPRYKDGSGGIDVCINYVGGEAWAKSLRCVRRGGRILTCGASAGYAPPTDLRYIWSFELNILGSNGWSREDHLAVLALIDQGRLLPVIDRVVPMEDIQSAMADLMARRVLGKVVIRID